MNNNNNDNAKGGDDDIDDQPSLILRKHVGLIHCENRLTLVQRKICNVLLFNALDKINQQDIFEITTRNLCSFIGYKSNDIALIKRSLMSLISTVLEWNLLDKNSDTATSEDSVSIKRIIWHASSLLAGASIEKGLIKYSYSPQIKTILSSLEIYGRINLFVQAKFNSTYGLVLYENCIRFKNIAKTCWFDLALFRVLMGIEKNKYISFKELKRNVITPAVTEINDKADIKIEPEYKKIGNKVTSLRFIVTQNEKYFPSLRKKRPAKIAEDFSSNTTLLKLTADFHLSEPHAKSLLEKYGEKYIEEKIATVCVSEAYKTKKIANLSAYIVSAITKDFQKNQLQVAAVTASVIQDRYILETQQRHHETKVAQFQKKYQLYKKEVYIEKINDVSETIKSQVLQKFSESLQENNTALFAMYKSKDFASMIVAQQFMAFIDSEYPEFIPVFLSYEDFLTADASEIHAATIE